MATASDVIALLRPQINDDVSPYRHSDSELLAWLSDGQRLIVQYKPEANPVTARFTPVAGTPRQRLDPDDAYALIRVERSAARISSTDYDGPMVRVVDQDVLDTFDAAWTTRAPTGAANGARIKAYAKDHDDPLGFWLFPTPVSTDRVDVTYVGNPATLDATSDALTLSVMYVDPLINYCMYRAAMSQVPGYSPKAAMQAMERFGQQLQLSRGVIQSLTATARRALEQAQ